MSTTVDQRVVEMRFDNKQFENNVQTSMSTIDKLKHSLNMTGASKGLENVNVAAKNCDMSGLSGAVETVKLKFSALQVMAVTALSNITTSALTAGKKIVSALTVDPIKTGFSEYETKINAIQTIMSNTASKGTTMSDVTRVIDELNTYADKTIYNFAEMTRNIGTFTAAGVGLEDSAKAIQGIANLAAASGSSSQQASTAMYQLSQALATGTVKLMDWNSVVNAGMGGEKFQQALKQTAKEHGVAVDQIIKDNGSFRDSLQEGWLSADILNETLNKFTVDGAANYAKSMMASGKWTQKQADALMVEAQAMEDAATKVKTFTQLWDTLKESAQSGWSQSWEIIVGDFEEAKELLTEVSNVLGGLIGVSADARNEVLQGWKDLGGRTAVIEALKNAFEGIVSIITPIKEAFRNIFPPITAKQLVAFSEGLRDLTAKLKISDATSTNLRNTFRGLFSVLNIGKQVFGALVGAIGKVAGAFSPAGNGIIGFTSGLGKLITKLDNTIEKTGVFKTIFNGLATVMIKASEAIAWAIGHITDALMWLTSKIDLSWFSIFGKIAEAIGKAFKWMGGIVNEAMTNLGFDNVLDVVNGGLLAAILLGVRKFMKSLTEITDNAGGFLKGVVGILDGIKGSLEAWQTSLKANAILKIGVAIGILAASILLLSTIDPVKMTVALGAITGLFIELFGSMAIFSKIMSSDGFRSMFKITTAMIGISVAVLILSNAMKTIADLSWGQVARGLTAIGALMAELIIMSAILDKSKTKMVNGSAGLISFATAILILAQSVKQLGKLSWKELAKGVAAVGALMLEMAIFVKIVGGEKKLVSIGIGLTALAAGMLILSKSVQSFAGLAWEEIAKGLVGVGVLLLELAAFVKIVGGEKKLISIGIGLTAVASAVSILSNSVLAFAGMSWVELTKGLVGLAGSLAILIGALQLIPKDVGIKAASLIVISTSLLILSHSLENMGSMTWEEIARGLVALAGALTIIVVAMKLIPGALAGAAALVIISSALLGLTVVMIAFGSMGWDEIGKSLLMLAGIFTVFGLAALALGPVVPVMIALGAAIALLGVGVLATGAGLLALAIGLTALAAAFVASGDAIFTVIKGLIDLIPYLVRKFGEGIIELFNVIGKSGESLLKAFSAIIGAAVDAIVKNVPKIVDGLFIILDNVLKNLMTHVPVFVDYIMKMFIEIIRVIARRLPELISAGVELLMAFVKGVISSLEKLSADDLQGLIVAIGSLIVIFSMIAALASVMAVAGVAILALTGVLAILGGIAQIPGLTWLVNEGGNFMGAIGTAIGSFVGGLVGGFAKIASGALPKIGENLAEFMDNAKPFFDGVSSINESASRGVSALATAILKLTAANILEGMTSWLTGGASIADFGKELATFGVYFKKYSDSVAGIDGSVIKASADAAETLSKLAAGLPNQGGLISWFTGDNSLVFFAEGLAAFGPAFKNYADSVDGIDPEVVIASANAAKVLSELASTLPNQGGMVSWFTGDNRLSVFAEELAAFGPVLRDYARSVDGVDPEVVIASANAAKVLSEFAMGLPNKGGMVTWFTGDNSLATFAEELAVFGPVLRDYAKSVRGLDSDVVITSANAAKALFEMAENLPNQGGMVSWFTGDNRLSVFAEELASFGPQLKKYADSVDGIDADVVINSANAAKALTELIEHLPNQGGVVSWFTGTNSLSVFAEELAIFGPRLKAYADSIKGIDPVVVEASANASKALAEMSTYLPNQGGMVSWFTGDNRLSVFADELAAFGPKLKAYADSVDGIDPTVVEASANAAKTLSEMASYLPDQGGIASWFTGDSTLSVFADELAAFGPKLKAYADSVDGLNPVVIEASANASKALAEMAANLPDQGGMVSWFTGDNRLSVFAGELAVFGPRLKSYADSVDGLDPAMVEASANAAKALAEMSTYLPNQGGMVSWFTGDNSLVVFGEELASFGPRLKSYADSVTGLDTEVVNNSANAALTLSEMAANLPNQGGLLSWFTGKNSITVFADELVTFGPKLKAYADSVEGLNPGVVSNSANAAKALAEMANNLPNQGGVASWFTGDNTIAKFGENVAKFGNHFKSYYDSISTINFTILSKVVNQLKELVNISKDISSLEVKAMSKFGEDLKKLGNTGVDGFISAFDNAVEKLKGVGIKLHDKVIEGFNSKLKGFENTGSDAAKGFIKGLEKQYSNASSAGERLGETVLNAAKKALDSHSPSKKFEKVGEDSDRGLINGLINFAGKVKDASKSVGKGALDSMSDAISGVSDVISGGIDNDPTIRPVLDLSSVQNGANQLYRLMNGVDGYAVSGSINMANQTANSMSRSAGNAYGDPVSAEIDGLKKAIKELASNPSKTFENVFNITGNNPKEIADEVSSIIQRQVERREASWA